ncbi:hypothetical protein VAE151_630423 [Vibrio aestuarianus]|nr:hypothetical protein VAE308_1150369 [Vibrio aestuarianus]CAH8223134.1 hypothetical protein VIBAE_B10510 [Vibrio aestuarianus subsp. francensis]CAH8224683.1 hypothetical protein VAE055_420424 [Vibrio aestuarianus]CAH8224718.1 hypothetical protein VAE032_320421 [Vibrio aestuarianus]CAH8225294.1 hypothetical protein VAE115_370423 [Vibrio aestuarianus]
MNNGSISIHWLQEHIKIEGNNAFERFYALAGSLHLLLRFHPDLRRSRIRRA